MASVFMQADLAFVLQDYLLLLFLGLALLFLSFMCWPLKAVASMIKAHLQLLKLPSPPAANFLLGHVGVLDNDRAPYLVHQMSKSLGRIFRLRLAWLNVVVVTDPAEAVRLSSRGEHYLDKSLPIYKAFNWVHNDPALCNILTGPTDDTWKAVRKAVAPCFTSSRLKAAFPLLLDTCDQITRQLDTMGPNAVLDYSDICKRFTLDAIATWGFCSPVNASRDLNKTHELVEVVDKMVHAVHMVLSDPLWQLKKGTKLVQEGIKAVNVYDRWMGTFASGLRSRQDSLPIHTVGGALTGLNDPAVGGTLSPDALKANVAILMSAGYETTASAMTSCLVLLANHPEWLEKLESEMDEAGLLKTHGRQRPRDLTWDDLGRLPVLNAIIKETLRLLPPAGLGSFRVTAKDTIVCGHLVPAETIVCLPSYAIDNSAQSFEDAELFNPDRWLTKNEFNWDTPEVSSAQDITPIQSNAVRLKEPMAFSVGPRDCVGQTLARLELQVFLAMLLTRFHLNLAPSMGNPKEARASIIYHLTFTMDNGLWMTAAAR